MTTQASPPRHWIRLNELTENELRIRVIVPLLTSMKECTNVTDVHGRNEKGLDVIFKANTNIESLWYGLQLKKDSISGGGTRDGTVQEIISQLGIASDLDHPIAVGKPGRIKIDRFIVATAGTISETAREEIASRLRPIPVSYWDGAEIERKIRAHLPELLAAVDGAAVVYLKKIVSRFDILDSLDQIPGVAQRTLSQVYVEPTLRRKFDPSVGGTDVEPIAMRIPALRLGDSSVHAVIIADQDAGKTSLLRMLAMQRARALLSGTAGKERKTVPVLIRARDFSSTPTTVDQSISAELERSDGLQLVDTLTADLNAGRYLVLVDGFSELTATADKVTAHERILDFQRNYPNSKVVVAARPVDFLSPEYFKNFQHYVIEEFSAAQVSSLLNRWTSDAPVLADVARRLVKRVREALQLPGSPISATIGVMLYEKERRYITNIAEAVDRYMVIRLGRYAHELGIHQQVEWTRKQDLLAEVAFGMIENDERALTESEFIDRFDRILSRLGETPAGGIVLGELLESGVLVHEDSLVAFHRAAFQDFFAAHAVRQRSDQDEFIRASLLDRKWGLAIVFAAGLRRKNSDLIKTLVSDIKALRERAIDHPGSDYLYGAYLIGRILSNSEASDERARLGALGEVLNASKVSLPEMAEEVKKQLGNIGEVAVLIAADHSFFVTVGVPWLEKQFAALIRDKALTEEERYLCLATYLSLGCTSDIDVLEKALQEVVSTRVLLALKVLIVQLLKERNLKDGRKERFRKVLARINRRLGSEERRKEVKELTRVKSKILELELKRMKRLVAQTERSGTGRKPKS